MFIVFLSIVNVVLILLNMMCNISFRNTVVMFKSLNAEQLEIHSSGSTYAQLMIRSILQSLLKHISKVAVFHKQMMQVVGHFVWRRQQMTANVKRGLMLSWPARSARPKLWSSISIKKGVSHEGGVRSS